MDSGLKAEERKRQSAKKRLDDGDADGISLESQNGANSTKFTFQLDRLDARQLPALFSMLKK